MPDLRPASERPHKYQRYRALRGLAQRVIDVNPDLPVTVQIHLSGWLRQCWRRRRISVHSMFAIANAFAKSLCAHRSDRTPLRVLRNQFRFAMRIAARDHDATTFSRLAFALSLPPNAWREQLCGVEKQSRERFHERVAAAANATELSEDIRKFVNYLSQLTGYRPIPVRFDAKPKIVQRLDSQIAARSEVAAYTDGQVIHLPAYLASSNRKQLNQDFLTCYLVAHEYLHLASGSFKFSFDNKQGGKLFRLLSSRRVLLKLRTRRGGISKRVRAVLQAEGIDTQILGLDQAPDLARFIMHFENQMLAQWLLNAFEDGRLERIMRDRLPGLFNLHRQHQRLHYTGVAAAPATMSALQNLIYAIGMYAADRPIMAHIRRSHQACLQEAKAIIDRLRSRARWTVYDSAVATLKIYEHLESQLPHTHLNSDQIEKFFTVPIDFEEIVVRMLLAEREKDPLIYELGGTPDNDEEFQIVEPGIWLPEWAGIELRPNSVRVSVQPFKPTKLYPILPDLMLRFSVVQGGQGHFYRNRKRDWHPDGPFLADERLAQYYAQFRAGFSDVQLNYARQQPSAPLKVTLLFDLSISNEARRYSLDGDTPIERAIQAGTWIARNLEAQGVQVAAYGGIDGGQRHCQLFELPKPVSQHISTLRCVGAGGFRLGAFIRAIDHSPTELGMTPFDGRHILIVLTDASGSYLRISSESAFARLHAENCPNCTSRHRCRFEIVPNAMDARTRSFPLFQPPAYALNDIVQARSDANIEVKMVIFDDHIVHGLLDSTLGPSAWQLATDMNSFDTRQLFAFRRDQL